MDGIWKFGILNNKRKLIKKMINEKKNKRKNKLLNWSMWFVKTSCLVLNVFLMV